jgi:uncharacterized protein (TIGR02271 family)
MKETVIGIFNRPDDAQNAAQKLFNGGFPRDHVDVSLNSSDASQNLGDAEQPTGFGDRISNFFNSLFDDEEDSRKYSSVARKSSLVTIQAETHEEAIRASQILDSSGAIDVDGEYRMGSAETEAGRQNNLANNEKRSIPVIEEQLQVGKREVETGRVKLRSRIIEKPVEETLRLREEHVNVERTPANRPANENEHSAFKEEEIEMSQTAEVPVVNKEARVVEEVNLNKNVTEREETVRDTVRTKDVDIENDASTNKRKGKGKM